MTFDLGPYFCANPHHALLHEVLTNHLSEDRNGVALEFGVGDGNSLRCIARYRPVIGFDSFKGLPEDWRPGFRRGMFKQDFKEVLARTPEDCILVPGLFQDTLPDWRQSLESDIPIHLVHIDCDLYSSTKTVFEHLPWDKLIRDKAALIFDEFHGYPGAENDEQRAWREFVESSDIDYDVIGHGHEQWAVRLK
ncbi:O-methyltransferase [Mycobacterium phage LittleLaf]|uniref:O-methyltransferase n=11 Tax=Marvinvirus TaxID=1982091 RepID=A0A482MDR2_9CAUD|nr:methyltransferase [Mycobacterium phage MosMoris]YP_009614197.1 methyltransferase [Mycobacterium phage Marvin]ANM46304.1 hypothetical protein SEA_GATTACA_82 [Mycobacterium phage Gattaca]AVE00826.1 O-methyltransferase [Mycobacterium phage Tesla]AYB69887.1 O-methyltransferase [Mycobacterium phage LittleLaf]AYB70714.1 O-methyltransferase [Mycobacterium phage VasuNzinga]QAX93135.1 O-methyltransferase [Mycobacterium phage RedRaider77]QBQ71375.1 O-methyltransferase [Mycobacterium phage Blackbeet